MNKKSITNKNYNNKNNINLNNNKNINKFGKRKKFQKNKIFNKKRELKTQNIILIKPPIYNIILKVKKNFNIKDLLLNLTKKGGFSNTKKRNIVNNVFNKKQSKEKTNKN